MIHNIVWFTLLTGWNSVFKDGSWRRFPDTDKATAADAPTTGPGATAAAAAAAASAGDEVTAVGTAGEVTSVGDTDYVNKS